MFITKAFKQFPELFILQLQRTVWHLRGCKFGLDQLQSNSREVRV